MNTNAANTQPNSSNSIDKAFEITYVNLALSNKQRRLTRIFRGVDAHAAKVAFNVWRQEQFVQFGVQYKNIACAEVLAEPTKGALAKLMTPAKHGKKIQKHKRDLNLVARDQMLRARGVNFNTAAIASGAA